MAPSSSRSSDEFETDEEMDTEEESCRDDQGIELGSYEQRYQYLTRDEQNKQEAINEEAPKMLELLLRYCRVNDNRNLSEQQRCQIHQKIVNLLASGNDEQMQEGRELVKDISEFNQGGLSNALREDPVNIVQDSYVGNRTILHWRLKNKNAIAAFVPFLLVLLNKFRPQSFTAFPVSNRKKKLLKGLLFYIKFSEADLIEIAKIQRTGTFAGKYWKDVVPALIQRKAGSNGEDKKFINLVEAFPEEHSMYQ